jgi:hypothetical protein
MIVERTDRAEAPARAVFVLLLNDGDGDRVDAVFDHEPDDAECTAAVERISDETATGPRAIHIERHLVRGRLARPMVRAFDQE